jgi:hypothetical protein
MRIGQECPGGECAVARGEQRKEVGSKRVHGAGFAGSGLIEEAAHAGGFVTLRGDKTQLATDVIWVFEAACQGLIGCGIGFEPGDAFLNGATEANADFEVVAECLFSVIAGHLDSPEAILVMDGCDGQITESRTRVTRLT